MVNAAYGRAVRNCPWVGQLWARALHALERSAAPAEQHQQLYERSLQAGLQVGASLAWVIAQAEDRLGHDS